jgi:hypothetical protein
MTDDPLFNEDDIRPDTVTVDRALLVRLARFVVTMESAVVFRTADLETLIAACEQIIKEHGE